MLKTSIDIQQEACILFVSAMFFPLQKLGIVCCTSSDEEPSQQYGWLRLSNNRRKFIRHFIYHINYIFTDINMSLSRSV